MEELLLAQLRAQQARESYAVATIAQTAGSTPRTSGKMLIFSDGHTLGTVGGGLVELQARQDALTCIQTGTNLLRRYAVTPQDAAPGASCSGEVTILIEAYGTKPLLVVCGGGHVGTCLMQAAKRTGFSVWLFDDRPAEAIAEAAALADRFFPVTDFHAGVCDAPVGPGAYFVICGHSHALDRDALHAALQKDAAYVGMLGSRRKIAGIFAQLRDAGIPQSALDSVFTPIGFDLGGQTPEELAIAILGQILLVKNRGAAVCRAVMEVMA